MSNSGAPSTPRTKPPPATGRARPASGAAARARATVMRLRLDRSGPARLARAIAPWRGRQIQAELFPEAAELTPNCPRQDRPDRFRTSNICRIPRLFLGRWPRLPRATATFGSRTNFVPGAVAAYQSDVGHGFECFVKVSPALKACASILCSRHTPEGKQRKASRSAYAFPGLALSSSCQQSRIGV